MYPADLYRPVWLQYHGRIVNLCGVEFTLDVKVYSSPSPPPDNELITVFALPTGNGDKIDVLGLSLEEQHAVLNQLRTGQIDHPRTMKGVPLASFFGPSEPGEPLRLKPIMLPQLQESQVIFGRDVTTGKLILVFGRDALQQIAITGVTGGLCMLVIEIDLETDDMATLLALVRFVKGRDDLQP